MNTKPTSEVGNTGITLSALGFGTMAIGGQFTDVTDAQAVETIHAALSRGIRFFDTAPQYGCGLAEERLGIALATMPRATTVVASKVGKTIAPVGSGGQRQRDVYFPGGHDGEMLFDYSRDGTLRSVEASLKRLRLDYLDIVLIHDVIRHFHGEDGVHDRFIEARDGAIPALQQLRDEGIVRAIGCGLKDVDIAARFIDEAEIDVVVLPGRLTLLDQSAITSGLADLCLKHGVALIPAAPFDSGILATGAIAGASYGYKPAEAAVITRVTAMEQLCLEHGVPIQAAALQYPKRHPAVASVLCGMRTLAHVSENVAWMEMPIPTELWTALRRETGLILPD